MKKQKMRILEALRFSIEDASAHIDVCKSIKEKDTVVFYKKVKKRIEKLEDLLICFLSNEVSGEKLKKELSK